MSDEDTFEPGDHTVEEVRSFAADCEDPLELRRVKTAEIQGKDRKTAKGAIDERLKDLADEVAAADSADDDADAEGNDSEQSSASGGSSVDGGETDVSESDNTSTGGHRTKPDSAAGHDTVVVRNPYKTTLQLQGLKGDLAPGETREYRESDTIRQYIRENKVQVVTSR